MAPMQSLIDHALAETPPGRPVWIALSGGLDSSLLLTLAACAAQRQPRAIYALHVNHGLQAAANDFENHCRALCSRLGVPLFVERVRVEARGRGVEAAARKARYAAFARRVNIGETLWLAQHRDDQAETLLLSALRGSGVRGMAAMPVRRDWLGRCLERPLLGVSRAALEGGATAMRLAWVDDPTNEECRFDRNFLRQRVMPLLCSRWPFAAESLARSAQLASEADGLLDELASLDLAALGGDPARLPVTRLLSLSLPRQRLLIRYACQRQQLPTPPATRLDSLLEQLASRLDAQVRVDWPGAEARIWRGQLYVQAPQPPLPEEWQARWDGRPGRDTPYGRIDYRVWPLVDASRDPLILDLSLRHGGERLDVAGRGHRDVKRLLQEAGVPPWRRSRQLLVWHGDTLVAVLGVAVAEGWAMRLAHDD